MQRRNFRFLGLALAGALALGTAACGDDVVIPEAAPTVTLTPSNFDLNVGETATVVASVTNLDNATFTFASSDASVASVTATGNTATIKALKAGSTTITVKGTANGKTVDAAVQVRVNAAPPAPKATISLTPTSTTINAGQQIPLVAIVSNAANPALTWTSSAPAVATVDANGVVTGVAQGTALVTAKLVADTTVKAISSITVNKVGGSAAIGISGIFQGNTFTPVNPTAVAGAISVQLNVTPGSTDSLRVFVDNTQVSSCSRNFAGTSNDNQVVTCVINTNALDANGNALFPNGAHVINARLFGNGQVAATATSESLTFANVNAMAVTVTTVGVSTANGTTIGADGLLWNEGNVVVTATPAVFTGNVGTVNAPKVKFGGSTLTMTPVAGTNSFTATFLKANAVGGTKNGVAGVSNDNLIATVDPTTTSGGFAFTGGVSAAIRLDNAAPNAGTIVLPSTVSNNFIGANFAFNTANLYKVADGAVAATDPAPGSGIAKREFFVGAAAGADTSNAKFVAANPTVITNSDQLQRSITNNAYIVVVRVTDFAGNVAYARLATTIGVDRDVPNITDVDGIENNTVVAGGDQLIVTAIDTTSGFGATPFEYRIVRTNANAVKCVNVGASNTDPACEFHPSGSGTYSVPNVNGYYQIDVRVRDRAGNVSPVISRFVLVDSNDPVVATPSGFNITNSSISLTGTATDNVSLFAYDVRIGFDDGDGGRITLPFAAPTKIGAFGLPILPEAALSGSTPLIRGLQFGIGGGVAQVVSAGFGAYDVAGNFGYGSINVTSPVMGAPIANAVKSFQVTNAANTTICGDATPGKAPCGSATTPIPSTRTVTATATGQTGTFTNPFTRVLFYRVDAKGQAQLIGEAGAPTFTDTGSGANGRTYTYKVTFDATGLPAQNPAAVFAVGIDAKSDAVMTVPVDFDIKGTATAPAP